MNKTTRGNIIFYYEFHTIEQVDENNYVDTYLNVQILKGNNKYPEGYKTNKISILNFINFDENENLTQEDEEENLIEKYIKKANEYKSGGNWELAAKFFIKTGEIEKTSGNNYIEAANCYKHVNYIEAINNFTVAIGIYVNENRFSMIARCYKEIAEIYKDNKDEENSLNAYINAAKYYNCDNKPINSNQCLIEVGTFLANKNEFEEAAKIFEKLGLDGLKTKLGSFSSGKYFLKSLYCLMAMGNFDNVKQKLEEFKISDEKFNDTREYGFVKKLLEACELKNADFFADIINSYDKITPLTSWEISILLKIKNLLIPDNI